MATNLSRRRMLAALPAMAGGVALGASFPRRATAGEYTAQWEEKIEKGLRWLVAQQSTRGIWEYPSYGPVPATGLAGMALLCSGSTTTQGPFAQAIRRAVDYLTTVARPNGLIGEPHRYNHYTYGHGFAMLFLSQVVGEEEDVERRDELVEILTKAVEFSAQAQTSSGGWGYVSARDGSDFDEGSTTVTQVQGLRGCRNAGIPVPGEIIEKAKQYIYSCKNTDGGISYSFRNRGTSRPAITAAAMSTLFNAGDYDSEHVPEMLDYCRQNLYAVSDSAQSFGHWHYTYLYYSQVVYREGDELWLPFREKLYDRIAGEQNGEGAWQGSISPTYVTSCNLIVLQLDKGYLPIFQR